MRRRSVFLANIDMCKDDSQPPQPPRYPPRPSYDCKIQNVVKASPNRDKVTFNSSRVQSSPTMWYDLNAMNNYTAFAEAIRVINSHLGLELGLTARGDELKGVQPDTDEGGTCRFYLDKRCLEELAEAFASAASEIREPMTIEEIVAYYKEHS